MNEPTVSPPLTTLRTSLEEGVFRITLDVPERRNAISPTMANELLHALGRAHGEGARVIVLGARGRAFCAGGDFGSMAGGEGSLGLPMKGDYADLLLAMVRTEVPIVAAVGGAAMGGGLGLVAASTFAIASTTAELGTPEIRVGLFPFMIAAVLSRLVPRRRLLEMMLLGERLSAAEAAAVGLVNRAVPPEALEGEVESLVAKLRAASPSTVRLGLRAFADQDGLPLEEALPLLRTRLFECLGTEDAREGLSAFLEKRSPVWKGR